MTPDEQNIVDGLYIAALNLITQIEMRPPADQIIWVGDRKTPVVDLVTFKQSKQAIMDYERYLQSKA